ncbi:M15 family metallopeptidase [Marinimicrobium alkaliphilum]|uniref:M15 family metallopeptidase n=1 Tax=Marinimicrobium alkaliphilum TaxID=2202654 RepID=UPI000DB9193A|nr:M15 family metallopeptidase [Marinimicrobium alkaliphilum]
MKRRDVLAGFAAGVGFTLGNGYLWQLAENTYNREPLKVQLDADEPIEDLFLDEEIIASFEEGIYAPKSDPVVLGEKLQSAIDAVVNEVSDPEPGTLKVLSSADDLLDRVRYFEREFEDDLYLPESERPLFHSVFERLRQTEKTVGHGNFNLLSFDELFLYARNYGNVGQFSRAELDLVDKLFFTDARDYGFFGQKVTTELTAKINPNDTYKVPYSGHFLLKGGSLDHYRQLESDIGDSLILTSGVRGNVKQMHLFMAKCLESNYNLSMASRSLAPPGYSYHGIGDFDVGRTGLGYANFTEEFAHTDEFKRMQDLGYIRIRYTEDNRFGVRFEPWHIKVV